MDQYSTRTRTRSQNAFTIIELLVVIAVIAVLSGIFFGVAQGVREKSRSSRSETELSLLAQYLEQYKAHYGDYPHVTSSESTSADTSLKREGEDGIVALYDALNGLRAINGTQFTVSNRERAFMDRSKFNHAFIPSRDPPTPTDPETDPVALLDPWGHAYRYFYEPTTPTWENPSYVLYSVGGDADHEEPQPDGYPDKIDPKNLDNIYVK